MVSIFTPAINSLKPELTSTRSNPTVNTAPDAAGHANDEAHWVQRARAGDTEAFRKLVERHRDRALHTSARRL